VAFADQMGVSQQINSANDGVLVEPGPDSMTANWRFAKEVLTLLRSPGRRGAMAEAAASNARDRCAPGRSIARYYEAFEHAREHCAEHPGPKSAIRRAAPLARWTWMHAALAGLGCIRPPAVVARPRGRPPAWETWLEDDRRRTSEPPPSRLTDATDIDALPGDKVG
jgi:hypothetical protein